MPPSYPTVSDVDAANVKTIILAAKNGDLGLLACTDAKTGDRAIILIAAYQTTRDGPVNMVPLARMFNDDPFIEVIPPDPAAADCRAEEARA